MAGMTDQCLLLCSTLEEIARSNLCKIILFVLLEKHFKAPLREVPTRRETQKTQKTQETQKTQDTQTTQKTQQTQETQTTKKMYFFCLWLGFFFLGSGLETTPCPSKIAPRPPRGPSSSISSESTHHRTKKQKTRSGTDSRRCHKAPNVDCRWVGLGGRVGVAAPLRLHGMQ